MIIEAGIASIANSETKHREKYASVPIYLHGSTLTPVWISIPIHNTVWDEATCPFPNVNGATEISSQTSQCM